MSPGEIILLHLRDPSEKFWGLLLRLSVEGITVRGLPLETFDDWRRDVGNGDGAIGVSTMFVPMSRVERVFLDERSGAVESCAERFERTVGRPVGEYL